MKAARKSEGRKLDMERLAQDFRGLDPNDPGVWPTAPKVAVFIGLLVVVVGLAYWFDWKGQQELLERRQNEEVQLRNDWLAKKRLAVNLVEYRQQHEETQRRFDALLHQLPNRAEMDSLLSDINQAGLGRGLQFDLFKPGNDVVREFYAEMPIEIQIVGNYHDLGEFASDVAQMPRIVTLSNIALTRLENGSMRLDGRAITYRYLDEDELAQQRRPAGGAQQGRGR